MLWQPGVTLEEVEKRVILEALQFFQSNKSRTAQSLGIAIRTLDSKLEQYGTGKEITPESDAKPTIGTDSGSGVHVESAKGVTEEQFVPLQKRQEVQKMPPKHASGRSSN